jgi:hypothetical protein
MTDRDQLGQLSGYLHQDWDLDHATVWDAVRAFLRDATAADAQAATRQAADLRDAGLAEEELARIVNAELGIVYWPPGDDLTFRGWLDELVRVLEAG